MEVAHLMAALAMLQFLVYIERASGTGRGGNMAEPERESYRIADLDQSQRPRERLEKLGAGALSNAELLAILIRVGVPGENAVELGQRLLINLDGLSGIQRAAFEDVCQQKGIGPAKAAQIKAAIELGNRLAIEKFAQQPAIHSPGDAADLVMYQMSALEQEELHVIVLDTRNHVLKIDPVYKGSLDSSQVRISELFRTAVKRNAKSIIVVHNHPSGDPTPSPDDIAITRAIVQAGKLLDIEVMDHLVIGRGRYVSLKERGLGFS
jgi:DNA repair protein RadC